jgi:hypothetical protein
MYRNTHETTTSNPLAWNPSYSANIASTGDDEVAADVDEPPDLRKHHNHITMPPTFQRTAVRGVCGTTSSLLTKAIRSETQDRGYDKDDEGSDSTEEEDVPSLYSFVPQARRRSVASNLSMASTAELTSDTGLTGPSRACTPSPPHPEMSILRIPSGLRFAPEVRPILSPAPRHDVVCHAGMTPKAEAPPRKRISFACGNPPPSQAKRAPVPPLARPPPLVKSPSATAERAPRQTRIKFACPARPAAAHNTSPPHQEEAPAAAAATKAESPSTPRKPSAFALRASQSPRPSPRQSKSPAPARRPKLLRASSSDMTSDASHFHEFASSGNHEDDWIRMETCSGKKRITIDDTLVKENTIRRLAKEVEEEAGFEQDDESDEGEEEDEDEDEDCDDDDDNDDDDDDDDDEYDNYDSDSDVSGGSDGYRTDEETGFADSDDSDNEELFWTPGTGVMIPGATYSNYRRRSSISEHLSDTSTGGSGSIKWSERRKGARRSAPRAPTPDLPDSTDFVCGTLDEDRPLEEAYMSALEARRREKLHVVIPQDIDPSFPMSEPEDDDNGHAGSKRGSGGDSLVHGEMDDVDHDDGGRSRRAKRDHVSPPRRYRSPPPTKRVTSPPLRATRGRAAFLGGGGAQLMSPPMAGHAACFDISMAKSLPKPTGMLHQIRNGRRRPTTGIHAAQPDADGHVRGAIDIVKGLEQKRKRRREKFLKNYCDRARKGQLPERKVLPAGAGAEKMKEIGLLMAGKKEGNFVLSV